MRARLKALGDEAAHTTSCSLSVADRWGYTETAREVRRTAPCMLQAAYDGGLRCLDMTPADI
jgi:hypothetical protein